MKQRLWSGRLKRGEAHHPVVLHASHSLSLTKERQADGQSFKLDHDEFLPPVRFVVRRVRVHNLPGVHGRDHSHHSGIGCICSIKHIEDIEMPLVAESFEEMCLL